MPILEFLGFAGARDDASPEADVVRHIVGELEALPEDRARYLATFAWVLAAPLTPTRT